MGEQGKKAWELPDVGSLPEAANPRIDTSVPHSARVYDYWLGGKDNFPADRAMADQVERSVPTVRVAVRENRAFLGRAVRHLVREAGVDQFLDIGAGLPSVGNVHEVAQAETPAARVVYVDNDPIVLAHARSLLVGTPEGRTAYLDADLRDPAAILADPVLRRTLDFDRPIGLILVATLHFLVDEERPAAIIGTLLDALPPGSFFAASHVTPEHDPVGVGGLVEIYNRSGISGQARTRREFTDLAFAGLELLDPGVTLVSEWRPDGDGPRPTADQVNWYAGVARKP
ncbi:SAM-dependent methyltransferase [Actinomadura parmotrematis]|uniref:SAM-dependent methyltransferase n=1 Tax=Actinomadura parmotrematis TaxID=2864039 RepID=A0ABS7G383_9ACTN|nr:SAM-dependent methyltransferase [Actinomadura parmotrematis]MBW8487176.1 SAM-dependent methyltransferase [Actinomadura parmotrematis]